MKMKSGREAAPPQLLQTSPGVAADPWALNGALSPEQAHLRYQGLYQITGETAIPWIVRLLENPASPVPFSGAVSLHQHDLSHCLLGQGIRNVDEAFVIGFTMGSVKTLRQLEVTTFRFVSRYLYPARFRLTKEEGRTFAAAVNLARQMPGLQSLAGFEAGPLLHLSVREVRERLGIRTPPLPYTMYAENKPAQ